MEKEAILEKADIIDLMVIVVEELNLEEMDLKGEERGLRVGEMDMREDEMDLRVEEMEMKEKENKYVSVTTTIILVDVIEEETVNLSMPVHLNVNGEMSADLWKDTGDVTIFMQNGFLRLLF